jgi:hypothetical protein
MNDTSDACTIAGICVGCCGHTWTSRDAVLEALRKNTLEYSIAKSDAEFLYRAAVGDLRSGVCRNLVLCDDEPLCPLHPGFKGDDIRNCNILHLCRTAYMFNTWDEDKKERFTCFVRSKGMDWFERSVRMDDGSLLDEFLGLQ